MAYRLQERAYGGLKPSTRQCLHKLAAEPEQNQKAPLRLVPQLKPGTKLPLHSESVEPSVPTRLHLNRLCPCTNHRCLLLIEGLDDLGEVGEALCKDDGWVYLSLPPRNGGALYQCLPQRAQRASDVRQPRTSSKPPGSSEHHRQQGDMGVNFGYWFRDWTTPQPTRV